MKEASKAMARRWKERIVGGTPITWANVFRGEGIDIGCGPNKIPLPDCRGFDKQDGDANNLSQYVARESLDYIHGSQCLEHMNDPAAAMKDWLTCLKPGGFMVQTVPDWLRYENMRWPSKTNPDHRSTWCFTMPDSPAPHHCRMPKWLDQFEDCQVLVCRIVDTNYDYKKMQLGEDQTWDAAKGVEAFIEFVLCKK